MYKQIPKIIHYCWFGGKPLPPLAEKCIASWIKYFPDYEIRRWDESNFDVNIIPYTQQAYEAKKFAFVSDYARFWILYNYGGVYFDTDVEVIKSFEDIIQRGSFMGCENNYKKGMKSYQLGVNPGLGIGAYTYHPFYKEILDFYSTLIFKRANGSFNTTTIVSYTTNLLCESGLKALPSVQVVADINIYPAEYFCPLNYNSGKILITSNTHSIHLYNASWHGWKEKSYQTFKRLFGNKFAQKISKIWKVVCSAKYMV